MERINNWEYGQKKLEQEDIESLEEWSDDKEMAYSIMDREFDYLWWEVCGKIYFKDRLYSCGERDSTVDIRERNGELELSFKTYDEVFKWIIDHSQESDDEWWGWMKERIGA